MGDYTVPEPDLMYSSTETRVVLLIYQKMADIMKDIGHIGKDSTNAAQKWNFRGIDAVYNSLHGLFVKHEVFCLPDVVSSHREERQSNSGGTLAFTTIEMRYTFVASDGSEVQCSVQGEGMDSGDKSSNKAMAIAHKYALLQVFLIPTAEQKDPDAEVHEITPKVDLKPVKLGAEEIIKYLIDGDEHGIKEIVHEFDADEQAAMWRYFNSQQRASIKQILKGE